MKKLLTFLMCFQLTLAPLSVRAEDPEVPPPPTSDNPAAGDAHYETGLGSQGGYDFYTKQVMILALGIIGSNIITQCPKGFTKPSVMAYSAAAVALIASEIFSAKAQNQKHQKAMSDIKMDESKMPKQGTEDQLKMLEKSLEEEEDLLEYVKKKRNWMIAITTIWTAAVGIAIGEQLYGMSSGLGAATATCGGMGSVFGAKCGPAAVGCVPGHIAACIAASNTGSAAAFGAFAVPDGLAVGTKACTPTALYLKGCMVHLKTYLGFAYAGCSPLHLAKSKILNTALSMAIMIAWGLAVNQIDGAGAISQYGMMIAGLLGLLVPSLSAKVVAAYNYPIPRSISFGAHAALGGVVIAGLQQRVNAAEENIANLNKVIKEFKKTAGDEGGAEGGDSSGSGSNNDTSGSQGGGDVDKLPDGLAENPGCLGEDMTVGQTQCSKPKRVPAPKFDFGGGLGGLKAVAGLGSDLGNAAAENNSARANSIVGEINKNAARVRDTVDKLKKKLNDKLKAEGKKPIDFDKEIKDQLAAYQGAFNQAAASKGFAASNFGGAGATLDVPEEKKTSGAEGAVAGAPAAAAAPGEPSFDLGLEDPLSEGGTSDSIAKSGEGIDQYETAEADISKAKDVPIWTQLSNRYILNYNKIFSRKPEEAAPAASPPKENAKK